VAELRKAYFSCVTFVDNLVGQLLQHLEDTGYADNTIVAFIGDHGFHLGEHGIFGKNTAFEVANNVPVILRVPGVTERPIVSDKLIELVDIFPTLSELAGLNRVPLCPSEDAQNVSLCTEGSSLVALLQQSQPPWKERVFYQYPHLDKGRGLYCMGYSMRTARYRYTEWVVYFYKTKNKAQWDDVYGVELYDHDKDPLEMQNLAEDARMASTRKELSLQLRAGWAAAVPK
jgi:iduronate 2-sulfatase